MTKRRGLGDAKGAELLRALSEKMKAEWTSPLKGEGNKQQLSRKSPVPTVEQELIQRAANRRRRSPPVKSIAKKKEDMIEVLRVPSGQKAAIMAAMREGTAAVEESKPKVKTTDFGEAAYRRISLLSSDLDSFAATHCASEHVSQMSKDAIERRIALGAARCGDMLDPDDGYVIGYDFGTSTSKSVLRHPYRGAGAAFAIALPGDWGSSGQSHLWPTVIWYDEATERFSPVPERNSRCLSGFKSALIEGRGHRSCCDTSITMTDAASAFFAMHVAYLLGSALERDPSIKIAGINVGIPVAALGINPAQKLFEKTLLVGLSLVPYARELDLTILRSAWDLDEPVVPFSVFPELSGAIAGYCMAPRYFQGSHMIIDCGSATLDIASFALTNSDWPIGIYNARVEPLGADACRDYIARGAREEDCREAARFLEFDVYRASRSKSGGFLQNEGKFPYQVILIGGGINGEVHKPFLDKMEQAFHRGFHRPTLAADLDFETDTDPGRLIMADGLARAPIDLREVALPAAKPSVVSTCIPDMISKDQV